MTPIILSDQEREKFALYLESDAASDRGMAEQLEKVPSPPTSALARKLRAEAVAATIVAAKLRAIESQVIK